MSRKVEIRTRMAELQKEFSSLNAEMKTLDGEEKRAQNVAKFVDYKFKVGTYGYKLFDAEKIAEVSDDDRATAHSGASGLAYCGYDNNSQTFNDVMLKSQEDYARTQKILTLLEAAAALGDEKTKDKEKHIKVLLGETDG
jgi:hypothetical protein